MSITPGNHVLFCLLDYRDAKSQQSSKKKYQAGILNNLCITAILNVLDSFEIDSNNVLFCLGKEYEVVIIVCVESWPFRAHG